MTVSFIVPLYKGQNYINKILRMAEANKSGLDSGHSVEIIFVNDFPSETLVLPGVSEKNIDAVKLLVNERNVGIHQSRIFGLEAASGEWVVFLDQDDTIAETYLTSQMEKSIGYDAVVSNGYWRGGEKIYSETYPFQYPCSFDTFLDHGYPLVSLGQLMVKKRAVPEEWTRKALEHNGCDDLYLWALMMAKGIKTAVNDGLIYTHEEDGQNASLNYGEMKLSIENVKQHFLGLNCVDAERSMRFADMMDGIASKYNQYEALNTVFHNTNSQAIEEYLAGRHVNKVAVYGVGIYGKALLKLLEETDIEVCYGIDMRADVKDAGIPVVGVGSDMNPVDAVIVTPISEFDAICEMLRREGPRADQMVCLNEILKEKSRI